MLLCSCHRIVWLISTDYYAVLYQHVQAAAEKPLHNLIFVTFNRIDVQYTTNNLSKYVLNNCHYQAISFYGFLLSIFQQFLKRYNYFDTGHKQLKLSWNLWIFIHWIIFKRKMCPALYVIKGGVNNLNFWEVVMVEKYKKIKYEYFQENSIHLDFFL